MTIADYILQVISLLGGLALFLFGMDVMGKALQRQAGGQLQNILAKMSSTVTKACFLGLAVTAVIQSSSATTVMVVGFVNSGIMNLQQAVERFGRAAHDNQFGAGQRERAVHGDFSAGDALLRGEADNLRIVHEALNANG